MATSTKTKTARTKKAAKEVAIPCAEEISKMSTEKLESALRLMCEEYNTAYQGGNFERAVKINDSMVEIRNNYANKKRNEVFAEIKKSSNSPTERMIYACKKRTWRSLGFSDRQIGKDKIPTRIINEPEMFIQLGSLDKWMQAGVNHAHVLGAEPNWEYQLQKLNQLYALKTAKDIGAPKSNIKDIQEKFQMSDDAKEIDLGKNACAKSNMVSTIQVIFDAMLGKGCVKADAHDAEHFDKTYSSYKKGKLTASANKALTEKVMIMCNHKLTNQPYELAAKLTK